jgi:transposase
MDQYVGLDVSLKETAVCVIDAAGTRVWQGVCRSSPEALAKVVRARAPHATRIALETGPLAVWHWHELRKAGLPVVCLHARHAQAALSLQINKTDANDAYGLAQIVRAGWYREVDLKSMDSYRLRLLLAARNRLVTIRTSLYNQIRGLLKTSGVVLPAGKGGRFERSVLGQLPTDEAVRLVIESLLNTWRSLTAELKKFDLAIERTARANPVCRRLMTVPGVGPVTAVAYVATIDDPMRFRHSKDVGAYLGLTPRRYQSGDVDRAGRISKSGDTMLRSLLFEAAHILLTRLRQPSTIRAWGVRLIQRVGPRKAKVAVARKLAVIMHRLWVENTVFSPAPTL